MHMTANTFQPVTIYGQQALLLRGQRLNRSELPKQLFCYDIRHADFSRNIPIMIEPVVYANYFGCIITKQPLEFGPLNSLPVPRHFHIPRHKISIRQFMQYEKKIA